MAQRRRQLQVREVGEHAQQVVNLLLGHDAWARLGRHQLRPCHLSGVRRRGDAFEAKVGVDDVRIVGVSAALHRHPARGVRPAKPVPQHHVPGEHGDADRQRYLVLDQPTWMAVAVPSFKSVP